ncbi:berberine bridge enzyme-like 21 [Senna tora]|uniref:Berberine bridge enzyme-like 21 n=1 Tax=Senna tora TaxID=362788 RepID=A0A834SD88_9FABA|nr:berberine bridge enzyme-like 21 [Senna tora]
MKPFISFLITFLLLTLQSSTSHASPQNSPHSPLYSSFLQCLTNHTHNSTIPISHTLYTQSNASYAPILQSYIRNARFNTSSTPKPSLILTPFEPSHVQSSVICAKSLDLRLRIRSGGHDYEGISYTAAGIDRPFVVLDMFNLRNVVVDVENEVAVVQSGATLGEFYYGIWEKSKVHGFPSGVCPTVGVGGHFSGGGYGNMIRKYGLSIDHIIDAEMVDSNGRILTRESMGEDLFWAIRGGGGASFGVILSYTVKLVSVPENVTVFRVQKNTLFQQNNVTNLTNNNLTDLVFQWQEVAPHTDNRLFMRLQLQPVITKEERKRSITTIRASILGMFLGESEELVKILDNEFPLLGLKKQNCRVMGWIESTMFWASFPNGSKPISLLDRKIDSANFLKRKSDYVETPISKSGLDWIWKKMMEVGKTGLVFNPYGGVLNEIPSDATPFPHRAGKLFKVQYSVNWEEGGEEAERNYTSGIRRLYSYMTPFVTKNPRCAFLNYRDLDIGVNHHGNNSYEEGEVYGFKYFNDNFYRLVKVKSEVDPQNFFRNEQSIPTFPTNMKHKSDMQHKTY